MKNPSEIVARILRSFNELELGFPGATRLTKVLYLFEVVYYRRHEKRATDIKWVFLHFGPYPVGLEDKLIEDGYVITEETIEDTKRFKRIFESPRYIGEALKDIDVQDKLIIDNLVNEWGDAELNELLDFVYYETEPMAKARRNEILDFSTISHVLYKEVIKAHIPEGKLALIRERIAQRIKSLKDRPIVSVSYVDEDLKYEVELEEPLKLPESARVKLIIKPYD